MPSARYAVSISLTKTDWERLKKLQNAGVKCVDIVRAGITAKETELKQIKNGG